MSGKSGSDAKEAHQRAGTRFLDEGRVALVTLRVDRRAYEFARHWAAFHAPADPQGTAEDHLEGYLGSALRDAMAASEWAAPPEIEALCPQPRETKRHGDLDDELPW